VRKNPEFSFFDHSHLIDKNIVPITPPVTSSFEGEKNAEFFKTSQKND
jgi:hypothetical protein